MTNRLPQLVDPYRLAKSGTVLRGRIELAMLPRLVSSLVSGEGEIEVELEFGRDEQGIYYICGSIQAPLQMQCQRCLEPMTVSIDRAICCALIADDARAAQVPRHYEPLLADPEQPLQLAEMIEDELILALPIVPTHDASQGCGLLGQYQAASGAEQAPAQRPNPFAVLADLKRNKS